MPKMIEIRLLGLFCDFAHDEGDDLEIAGRLHAFTTVSDTGEVHDALDIFTFPDGPISIRPQQFVAINHAVRLSLATPSIDTPPFVGDVLHFGGTLFEKDKAPDTDDRLNGTMHHVTTIQITQAGLVQHHHIHFSDGLEQDVRADFDVELMHFI